MIFDIIMVIILALSILLGYKKGVIMTAFSLVSVVLAIIIAQLLCPVISETVMKSSVDEVIEEKVSSYIFQKYEEKAVPALEQERENIIKNVGLPGFLENYIVESDSPGIEKATSEVQKISAATAIFAVRLLVFVITAVVTVLVLLLLTMVLKLVRRIPAVEKFDHGGGALLGAVVGLGFIYVVCLMVYALSFTVGGSLGNTVNTSVVVTLMEKLNLFSLVM